MTMNGELLVNEIKLRAPKDEGDMGDNVIARVSRDGLSVQVGYGNRAGFKQAWKRGGFHALFQEYGTRHHGAQPFIGPAFRAKLGQMLNRIDSAVNRTLRRASSGNF
jgi:HK97 gp10 family phage protein